MEHFHLINYFECILSVSNRLKLSFGIRLVVVEWIGMHMTEIAALHFFVPSDLFFLCWLNFHLLRTFDWIRFEFFRCPPKSFPILFDIFCCSSNFNSKRKNKVGYIFVECFFRSQWLHFFDYWMKLRKKKWSPNALFDIVVMMMMMMNVCVSTMAISVRLPFS